MEVVADGSLGKLADLPDEIRQLIELKKQNDEMRIEALSKIVAENRDEAIEFRKKSGIEKVWDEDEQYYLGIDQHNTAETIFTKGMGISDGIQSNTRKSSDNRSTAFFNVIRQFVDSASARVGDILLPAGDWNWTIKPTPIPDLDKIKGSNQPVISPNGNVPRNEDGTPYTLGQFHKEELEDAGARVKKAETRIKDWLTECHFSAEERKVIESSAKIGTGILRGPMPVPITSRAVVNGALVIKKVINPGSRFVDPRNFFPAPNCGDNLQRGSYCLELDFLSPRELRALRNEEGYITKNIDKVLAEGPEKCNAGIVMNDAERERQSRKRFKVWYYFGDVNIDDLNALGAREKEEGESGDDMVPAICIMVNDTIIKGIVNPLDNGEFPYDVMAWQRIPDSIYGIGIARQGRVAQDMLNSSMRALMDNMGLSAGVQLVLKRNLITPADGNWTISPRKLWYATEDGDNIDVRTAIQVITIPSVQAEIGAIIDRAYKMMEDATGVSFLLQGQQGSAPDTVGGMQLLHLNASSLLRRIARVFDENVTEPHIRRYYDWLLIHGEDDEKGDFKIQAVGSSALVEREIQAMQAQSILQMSLNPIFGYSPKKAADEVLRAMRFEPSKFEMGEEEKAQMAQASQGQVAPAVQAAQIRAQSAEKIAQARAQADAERARVDLDRDRLYSQTQANREAITAQSKREELALRRELALLEYANRHQLALDSVKAQLAQTAMKLRTTKELAAIGATSRNLPTPPIEPPGRAPAGQSFAR